MKTFLTTLILLLAAVGGAGAQTFRVGVRGGLIIDHYSFDRVSVGDAVITPGSSKPGYQLGLVARISIPKFIHFQPEMVFTARNYHYTVAPKGGARGDARVRTARLELPVAVGFNIQALRLFGGPVFRLDHTVRSNNDAFAVRYNDSDVGLMLGAGLDIRRFFIDVRYTTYAGKTTNWFSYAGQSAQVKIRKDNMWTFSAGFFF
ncbi:MAG: PorT family protein [Rikenellaceae bacterium]|nr:PorT family protein [Rikenellaceae bacterium]